MSTPIGGSIGPQSIHGSHIDPFNSQPPKIGKASLPLPPQLPDLSSAQPLSDHSIQTDKLLEQELDLLIEKKEAEITDQMHELNQAIKDQKMVKGLIEVGKWAHEYADTAKDIVQDGIEFLEAVLPQELLQQGTFTEKSFKELNQIAGYAGRFLTALDMGMSGLAMILKGKILDKSKEVLGQLKQEYSKQKDSPEVKKHIREWQAEIKKAEKTLSRKELRKLEKAMKEMDIKVKIEGDNLSTQKMRYGVKTTKNLLSFLKIPLKLLPIDQTLAAFKMVSTGLSTVTTTLGIILAGFVLHKNVSHALKFNRWAQAFHDWKVANQPVVEMGEKGIVRPLALRGSPVAQESARKADTPSGDISIHLQTEEEVFLRLMHKYRTIEEIRQKLKDFDIDLDPSIKTTEQLFETWQSDPLFRQTLTTQYTQFKGILENFDLMIQASQDLLEKRKILAEKKVFSLKPHFQALLPKIKELKRPQFERDLAQFRAAVKDSRVSVKELKRQAAQLHLPFNLSQIESRSKLIVALENLASEKPDALFNDFIAATPAEKLLHFYVDHQETVEQVTKNALKEMVSKKLEIEGSFIKFKTFESATLFTMALASAVVSITLAIIGLATTPVAGAGFILLGLSAVTTAVSLGLFGASYYYAYRNKPAGLKASLQGVNSKLMLGNVMASIQEYRSLSKKKKMQKTAEILQHLHKNKSHETKEKYEQAFAAYEKAKLDYSTTQSKADAWKQRVNNLQNQVNQANWQDFAQSAALRIDKDPAAFDTLRAFNESLLALDLRFISDETKALLQTQLGLNVEALQEAAAKDPTSAKKALQKFFMMDDSGYVNFIHYQEERIKAGMIPSLA
ncbi:hypothetical protein PNK_2092 [Candidatus Protochlamydia naegleriophila]|uniref:Uncharacterized protein n=1 Tax=Candidatus Protochlamydia naegleriophila TaxID=389348 RepID=A0A0U5ETW2_9BACT|nr:hypothetical protein [Candidatus Protochlamydia naegleriophila]CUI17696.1 hypothetical protein PNK_2092 [Candidatus Protochlamydia naegleriophila]